MAKNGRIDETLSEMTRRLSEFLADSLEPTGRFPERTFYGEAFAACAWHVRGEYRDTADRALSFADTRTETEACWHEEFVLYARTMCGDADGRVSRFTHSVFEKPTNWLLLRSYIILRRGGARAAAASWMVRLLLLANQERSGLIIDRRIGRMIRRDVQDSYGSTQYHAFMAAVLTDIIRTRKDAFLERRLQRAVTYLLGEIDETGRMHSRGRGAAQLFGYASAVYTLSAHKKHETLERMIGFIQVFQDEHGAFPLVLVQGDDRTQWESYNNLFDYLPFALWMFERARSEIANDSDVSSVPSG